ncbi:hypothetical protein GLOIN_2v1788797 [Rhizophagus irregularis DAOM 181602=DAOM 197198]|nr:hypothetical protein GLOIN_2v1788797 [Rhizophagus irregularis DAOM 181602=DAOM 197198]
MKEQYKNFKVPDSYLEQQKDLRHNLDLYDDNPSLEIENHKLRAIIADLCNKNTKLEKTNVDIFKELKSLKEDFSTLMEINDAFTKGKRSIVQISDNDDKDEDVDDDLMDSKSNATEKSSEEPNEREARIC